MTDAGRSAREAQHFGTGGADSKIPISLRPGTAGGAGTYCLTGRGGPDQQTDRPVLAHESGDGATLAVSIRFAGTRRHCPRRPSSWASRGEAVARRGVRARADAFGSAPERDPVDHADTGESTGPEPHHHSKNLEELRRPAAPVPKPENRKGSTVCGPSGGCGGTVRGPSPLAAGSAGRLSREGGALSPARVPVFSDRTNGRKNGGRARPRPE